MSQATNPSLARAVLSAAQAATDGALGLDCGADRLGGLPAILAIIEALPPGAAPGNLNLGSSGVAAVTSLQPTVAALTAAELSSLTSSVAQVGRSLESLSGRPSVDELADLGYQLSVLATTLLRCDL